MKEAVQSLRSCECHRRNGRVDEALQTTRLHIGQIDLLITDIVMPAMNGRDLAQILTAKRPGLKVLFTSGYTDNAIFHNGTLTNEPEFLAKPFVPQALSRKVREVLDKESAQIQIS